MSKTSSSLVVGQVFLEPERRKHVRGLRMSTTPSKTFGTSSFNVKHKHFIQTMNGIELYKLISKHQERKSNLYSGVNSYAGE